MADRNKMLGKALCTSSAIPEDKGFVEYFKASIKSYQGDGVSAQTHKAMKDAGIDAGISGVDEADVQDAQAYVGRQQSSAAPRADATITMPNGTRVTPLEWQKLQQMLLKRG